MYSNKYVAVSAVCLFTESNEAVNGDDKESLEQGADNLN